MLAGGLQVYVKYGHAVLKALFPLCVCVYMCLYVCVCDLCVRMCVRN